MNETTSNLTWREKYLALVRVVRFQPRIVSVLVILGGATAFLEGIGLSFIHPILEVAQAQNIVQEADGVLGIFLQAYRFVGVPFTLEYLILGVSATITVRFILSFVVSWMQDILEMNYEQHLRRQSFRLAVNSKTSYFDKKGSDNILNTIITETRYSGRVISHAIGAMQTLFLVGIYVSVMLYIAPTMTIYALGLLGGITFIIRYVIEPAYTVGNRVAEANEQIQQSVQAGIQGIRDVKLFELRGEVFERFADSLREYTQSSIDLSRNDAAIRNFYDLSAALTLFSLIYIGFRYSGLSLGELGIFLLAMFRLSPLVSRLNSKFYMIEGNLSHLTRTQEFVDAVDDKRETSGDKDISRINQIDFDSVDFSYEADNPILRDISFKIDRNEFIAFVGQSGAGKSTIISLLARLYEPSQGEIRSNGVSIKEYDLNAWRSRIAVVRQQPYIFNDTLRRNITIADRSATHEDVERVSAIARVDEFVTELPNGYDSQLGDDGVQLSGGQRQRVALARALIKDADFLLLDEATSDLDSNLEREVQAAIEEMDSDYGIIAIAHRLSTVQNAERIYTLDDGKIIETGTHQELLNDDGEYAELYDIQSTA